MSWKDNLSAGCKLIGLVGVLTGLILLLLSWSGTYTSNLDAIPGDVFLTTTLILGSLLSISVGINLAND